MIMQDRSINTVNEDGQKSRCSSLTKLSELTSQPKRLINLKSYVGDREPASRLCKTFKKECFNFELRLHPPTLDTPKW